MTPQVGRARLNGPMLYATAARTHLGAIRRNLEAVRARVGDRRVLAAVKANAYGHGAVEVSRMIERTGCADWLGVATVPEALELRAAGVTLPILKMSHALGEDEVEAAVSHDIDLTVCSAAGVDAVAAAATRAGRRAAVHLKVDTGMRRIGCAPAEAPALARRIDEAGPLRLRGVFSHLPVSDSEDGRVFTEAQVALFRTTVEAVESARGAVELVHLANSGAVLMHPEAWFGMVRPGVMVYGNLPDPTTEPTVPLEPALTWTTRLSFVKRVPAGETVGYGRTWTAPRETWIGTIPVGYGDGFSRLLSNRGRVLIAGSSRPIVGRVCMDQSMVDLGPGSAPPAKEGDEVVLIGRSGTERITVQEVATLMGTITYEVTCLVGGRVTRELDDV